MKQGVWFIVRQPQAEKSLGRLYNGNLCVKLCVGKAKSAVKHMLVGASMASATGDTMGAILAVLRNKSIKFYAASMGSNFFLLSSTYIAFEEIISDKRGDKKDWITGAAAGTITGGFYAGLVGGPVCGLQGATTGEAVGEAVVFGRKQFHSWRLSKVVQRYQSKYGEAPAMYPRRLHC
ncbi:hypothetical protein PsorP6_010320 [Peronosclerospora sorghi]|uniref:Uncharacterized protein n=1 Tax=Peronosclerospora sorghi TaxID=230839 RepID=A0ACC0VYA8_9STRA|nr:hypothetical protein PsorP6_010320 [Peronosclerospora sorghi]